MNNAFAKLKQEWENNPLQVIVISALVLTAGSKFLDSASSARSRRAYSKAVDYRIRRGI